MALAKLHLDPKLLLSDTQALLGELEGSSGAGPGGEGNTGATKKGGVRIVDLGSKLDGKTRQGGSRFQAMQASGLKL